MGKVFFLVMALLLTGSNGAFSQHSGTTATYSYTTTLLFAQQQAAASQDRSLINNPEWGIYFDVMGWLGTFFYVLAYLLLTLRKIRSQQRIYHLLNVLGALGLIANAIHLRDMPSLVVNIVWLGIGVLAILWIVLRKKEKAG